MSMCIIFPPKTARDPRQRDMVAYFCVIPRQNWAKLGGLTLSLSDFLLVLCRRILPDCFRALEISYNHSGPWCQTAIFSAILHGAFDRADDARTLNLQIWLTFCGMDFEKMISKFGSMNLRPSLAASVLIMEPNDHGLHELECL